MSTESFRTLRQIPEGGTSTCCNSFWGLGTDGVLNTTGNVSLGSGDNDSGILVKHYTSLTINMNHIVSMAGRNRAVVIYVSGDCCICGTLTNSKGATSAATKIDINRLGPIGENFSTLNSRNSEPGYIITVTTPAAGGAGAAGVGSNADGTAGTAGSSGGLGGGGSGGRENAGTSGAGVTATSYSSGPGGGGAANASGSNGVSNGGAGGAGGFSGAGYSAGGGAGNPGGANANGASDGGTGTGGTIILLVRGILTITPNGIVSANGTKGGDATAGGATGRCAGGSSGGGRSIVIYSGGTSTNYGTVQASGGVSATASGATANRQGGAGGAGSTTVQQVMA